MSDGRPLSLRVTITLVRSIVWLAVPAWADFQAGMDANNRGDYATALREWRPLAAQGDALAQYNLGVLYRKGRGVSQDDVQARQWYEKAAVQGQTKAQFNLGTLYFNGEGVPKDYQQALRWFRLARKSWISDAGMVYGLSKLKSGGHQKSMRRIASPKDGARHRHSIWWPVRLCIQNHTTTPMSHSMILGD